MEAMMPQQVTSLFRSQVGPSETIQQHGKPRPREGRILAHALGELPYPCPEPLTLRQSSWACGSSALDLVPHALLKGHAILVFVNRRNSVRIFGLL